MTDLNNLKSDIKKSAEQTRQARIEARKLSGMARHNALEAARDTPQRERLLAYGYLRGRTRFQIEQKSRETPWMRYVAQFAGVPVEEITAWFKSGDTRRERPQSDKREVA